MTHRQLVQSIRRRMKTLRLTPYQLHQELAGKVSKQTVYNFVEHGKTVRSDTLLAFLGALGLAVAEVGEGVSVVKRTSRNGARHG